MIGGTHNPHRISDRCDFCICGDPHNWKQHYDSIAENFHGAPATTEQPAVFDSATAAVRDLQDRKEKLIAAIQTFGEDAWNSLYALYGETVELGVGAASHARLMTAVKSLTDQAVAEMNTITAEIQAVKP